jgi:hypothetical protein
MRPPAPCCWLDRGSLIVPDGHRTGAWRAGGTRRSSGGNPAREPVAAATRSAERVASLRALWTTRHDQHRQPGALPTELSTLTPARRLRLDFSCIVFSEEEL